MPRPLTSPAPDSFRLRRGAPRASSSCAAVAIAVLSFGPRSALGFFLTPLSHENGWGREVFSLALAVQNLLWGAGVPFSGAIADRFGTMRVLIVGTLMYAAGLVIMAYAQSPAMFEVSAGVLVGLGMSGCSFNLVLAAFGKLLPEEWRSLAFGAGTAAGSFGQFMLFSARGCLDRRVSACSRRW